MKTFFVLSDIHGRRISEEDFIEKGFEFNNMDHIIVLLGDYFDRHPFNEEVLSFCERMHEKLQDRFIMLKGNHDEFFMNFVNELEGFNLNDSIKDSYFDNERWLRNGGAITIDQVFGPLNGVYDAKKLKNMNRLKHFGSLLKEYYESDEYVFTHASINEERKIDVWNRDFFHQGMNTDKTVIIGHTTYKYLENFTIVRKNEMGKTFTYAHSNEKTKCKVFDIDNGCGNNIAIFKEKI